MASSYKGFGTSDNCKRWDKSRKEYKPKTGSHNSILQ
jgi:hypothetical protein